VQGKLNSKLDASVLLVALQLQVSYQESSQFGEW